MLNPWFISVATRWKSLWQRCFSLGALLSPIFLLISPILVSFGLIHIFRQISLLSLLPSAASSSSPSSSSSSSPSSPTTSPPHDPHPTHAIHTSDYNASFAEWAGQSGEFVVAVLPGVNIAWRDTALYLLLVLVVSVWHEAGHAIAAACESIPPLTLSLHLYLIYPAAAIHLDAPSLSLLPPLRRLRVLAAGSWANAILALVAWVLAGCVAGLSATLGLAGGDAAGADAEAVGLRVTSITPGSVLDGYVLPGDIISSVDGVTLVGGVKSWEDAVRASLNAPDRGYLGKAWCADRALAGFSTDTSCCSVTPLHPLSPTPLQCFAPAAPVTSLMRTLSTLASNPSLSPDDRARVLDEAARKADVGRLGVCLEWGAVVGGVECREGWECGTGKSGGEGAVVKRAVVDGAANASTTLQDPPADYLSLLASPPTPLSPSAQPASPPPTPRACLTPYIPHPHVRLLRLGISDARGAGAGGGVGAGGVGLREVAILGDPREAWESVTVATPTGWVGWVVGVVGDTLRSLSSLSLALSLFNMTPAAFLDGSHCLSTLVEHFYPPGVSTGAGAGEVWRAVSRVVVAVCSVGMGGAVVGGVVLAVGGG
ncbi:hypothetical protein M427DRAFT_435681 [Gonapodya prolifera JEL478]|uniref:Endopeptidase S2P n=1 Tax=Gonapodya prolifera (strain JEL478) TaxID=1344416 RepID=A0A139A447_GONPJ|nr:hypothetical protein M427DRAFT_435681 [Gonapodya prolifera JEL478]|eukprot:KXS11582.1 hypothetical protein M427DRAFT_435681 [Gonapodya prolifera JEL478]